MSSPFKSPCSGMWSIIKDILQGPDDFQWGVGQISIMLRIILKNFSIKNAKSWKPRKSRLEIPTRPGNPSTRHITFRIVVNLADFAVEREKCKQIIIVEFKKQVFRARGDLLHPKPLYFNFLEHSDPLLISRSTSFSTQIGRFTTIRKVIALVEGFPGFVGISNHDFRGFQEFAFFIQKKLKMIRSIIEICPTPHWKC